jgi:hypothetical protein
VTTVAPRGVGSQDTGPPVREAVLTTEQVAAWLQISPEQVRRLHLPAVAVGKRKWRYVCGQVLDELQRRAE